MGTVVANSLKIMMREPKHDLKSGPMSDLSISSDAVQPASSSDLKETFLVGSLGSLLLLLLSWPAFKFFFFAEAFWQLRIYDEHGRHLWRAAFSRIDGMFFRPGFFLAQIVWDFILPANPTVYHIRNFVFCAPNPFLL